MITFGLSRKQSKYGTLTEKVPGYDRSFYREEKGLKTASYPRIDITFGARFTVSMDGGQYFYTLHIKRRPVFCYSIVFTSWVNDVTYILLDEHCLPR